MNVISRLLATDGFITVNKALIKIYGLNEAVMLGELCSEYNYWAECGKLKDDKFYSTRENIEENTGLSGHLQRKALEHLIDEGIIEVTKEDMPAINYYKIDFDKLLMVLTTSDERFKRQVVKGINPSNNIYNKNKEKQSISKDIDCTEKFNFGHFKSTSKSYPKEIETFKDLYNEHCNNLPKIVKLTDKRIKAIKNLLKKYSYDDIIKVFDSANNSDFLTGNNDTGWKADIDFICREDKFINILENKYGGHKKKLNVVKDIENLYPESMTRATTEQKKQFKEDIQSGKAEKF